MLLRDRVLALEAELADLVASGMDNLALGARRAAAFDAIVREVFAGAGDSPPLVLAAVGTFGRQALSLKSDVDVLLLVPKRYERSAAAAVDAILYPLWDAKIPISHQTLSESEAEAGALSDLATATALLDARWLAGDPEPLARVRAKVLARLADGAGLPFFDRLDADVAERQAKWGETVHLLEPDVKSSEGGLRDLDVARWTLRVATKTLDGDPLAHGVAAGLVDEAEAARAGEAEALIHRVRNRLHAFAGRRSDRLSFELQERIAAVIEPAGRSGEDVTVETERFMQRYYRAARAIDHLRSRVAARTRPAPKARRAVRAAEGVELRGEQVHHASELSGDPALALRIVAAAVLHQVPIAEVTRDAIARAAVDARFAEAMRASPEAQATFVDLLCVVYEGPFPHGSIATELAELGLLVAMIPEFSPVIARVHHDVYHVYTVDAHSVAALDRLRALARGDLAETHPLATRLGAEIERRRPLFLATLLHDVGKGYPEADGSRRRHAERGAELCRVVLPRLGLSAAETDDAAWLVLQHLALYHAATRRDIEDAHTLDEVARIVRGREGLRDLYLLTVSDVSTTSPTALTAWKASVLEELYHRTDAFLSGARGATADAAQRERAALAASLGGVSAEAVRSFLEGMPSRYLFGTTPARLARHVATFAARGSRATFVDVTGERGGEVVELCVVARDRPGVLARIAAALTASGLEVLAAGVFTRASGPSTDAVDLFLVRDPRGGVEAVRAKLPRLQGDLEALAEGALDPEALVRERRPASPWSRPTPAIRAEVTFDLRASADATVVEIFAKDRPGLLFRLAHALEELGLSIVLSRINTEGTKVADVFYVQAADGSKITDPARLAAIRERVLTAAAGD